ncbi:MAG: hypothetical protein AAFV59_00420 [Pseudomonadota bacterium]
MRGKLSMLIFAVFASSLLLFGCEKANDQFERSSPSALTQGPIDNSSNQNTLSHDGAINTELLDAVRNAAERIDFLEVTSHGGDMMIAIEIAKILDANEITLIVKHYCLSACAHFMAMPVDRLVIEENAVIGFHHTSLTLLMRAWRPMMLETPRIRELIEIYVDGQVEFFQREGIDQRWLFEADIRTSPICIYFGIVQGQGPLVNYENEFDFLVLTNSVLQVINPNRERFDARSELTEAKLDAFKKSYSEYESTSFLLSSDPIISVTEQDVGALRGLPLCGGSLFSK